ncbi:pirin family protein [Myxococcus stipitatus DSM 14675]|uniref:Pirin family protein n=1 Tax=Myxococcus stipitatus (strain DSM 14675 / JCM 12634 / Mx s8) TaxID=1278073 RepID=L7UNC0_MYXSD|nr:pirin family protein [Myxococcus stipitatus]AGC49077.1 pirin family protein [Myxococcus stipitatus DSM 14675]
MSTTTQTLSSPTVHTALPRARTLESVHGGGPLHWVGDGFRVKTVVPSGGISQERVSPFLLLDHHPPYDYAPLAQGQRGVGWHPHRGFETVTLAFQGHVAHRDNAGHSGVIGPGDVQWMTAASGILHEEYHEQAFSRRGGPFEMLQLWVNLPRTHKKDAPGYQPITAAQIPTVAIDGGTVRVIAGPFGDTRGPARTFTPITLLDVRLRAGSDLHVALPKHHNTLVLVASGRISSGGERASQGDVALFANDGDFLTLRADEDTHLLVLSGEPIREPIVHYGPFVMNSQREVIEAIHDFEAGRFGSVPEDAPGATS